MDKIKIYKCRNVKTPTRGTNLSAGVDFYVPNDWNDGKEFMLFPKSQVLIPSGIYAKFDSDKVLIAFNKSGVALKKNLLVGACVIDADYQGEIHINLFNNSDQIVKIMPGEKIVQFLLLPIFYPEIEETKSLENLYQNKSERSDGGFGSTGNY